jgi:hypothetical protein
MSIIQTYASHWLQEDNLYEVVCSNRASETNSRHTFLPAWFNVTLYYVENLEELRSVINELGKGDASSTAVL